MAATSTIIAAASLFVGTAVSLEGQSDARDANRQRTLAQEKIQAEQKAANAAEQAKERRQQIREERVRRARIIQSAVNTGVEGSSGELGAVGSLSTQLASNIATNIGRIQSANNISIFQQDAANAETAFGNAQQTIQTGGMISSTGPQLGKIGGSIAGSDIFNTQGPLDGFFRTGRSGD